MEHHLAKKVSRSGLDDFVQYLQNPWQIIWSNFLAGIFRGLGFMIGATVILTVVIFILIKILGNLPLVGDWFANAGEWFKTIQEGAEGLRDIGR